MSTNSQEKEPLQQWGDGAIEFAARHKYLVLRVFCATTLPFRRFGGGREVEGRAWALAALLFWAFFTHDLACLYYFYAWLVAMVIYKLTTTKNSHSEAEGWPLLSLVFPNYWLASTLEAAAVLMLGYSAAFVAPMLGLLWMASGGALVSSLVVDWWHRRQDVIQMTDRQREMEQLTRTYRERW